MIQQADYQRSSVLVAAGTLTQIYAFINMSEYNKKTLYSNGSKFQVINIHSSGEYLINGTSKLHNNLSQSRFKANHSGNC
jgi:hypothetical protein